MIDQRTIIDSRGAFADSSPKMVEKQRAQAVADGKYKPVVVWLPKDVYDYYETCAKIRISTMDLDINEILVNAKNAKVLPDTSLQ
jgi:PleD family two-component response regulator